MKKTLLTLSLIGALVTPSIAADDHSITVGCATWYEEGYEPFNMHDESDGFTDSAGVVVSFDKNPLSLAQLNSDVSTLAVQTEDVETVRIEDCTITVDDVVFPPAWVEFFSGCELDFTGACAIEDEIAAVSVGAQRAKVDNPTLLPIAGALTFKCTEGIAGNEKWQSKGDYITEDLLRCMYFDDGTEYGSKLSFVFGDAEINQTDTNSGLKNVGFIDDKADLGIGEVGLLIQFVEEDERGFTGSVVSVVGYNGPAAPEPATGTLSLLALAGLATRRRRK